MISAMLPTVDAEIGGNVVLPISAKQHPFYDRDLSVIQCHVGLSALELRSDQYATIRAQSCARGNVNPQISRLGNGPDRDPNPARRSLDLQRQSCSASCVGRRGIEIGFDFDGITLRVFCIRSAIRRVTPYGSIRPSDVA